MTKLSNIFSREKTLFYFSMWNDSDRLGYERFLGYQVKHNLFIIPKSGEKGSVWYPQEELDEINRLLEAKLVDPSFESAIVTTLDSNWLLMKPYIVEEKKVKNADELQSYYKILVEWWSAMNTVFSIPDMDTAPAGFKHKILTYRTEYEKYTERMNYIFVEFVEKYMPEQTQLISFLLPEEVTENSSSLKERLEGCFMYDGKVYPLRQLSTFLKEKGLELEEIQVKKTDEIKGRPAYTGKAIGPVKIIKIKADTTKILPGDIMVTEMTNPDYVPFMKIAAAIITDEGGATCHAAIASRELKVPCIVGTRVATKVLKDGDMVEVDAEKGIVRIITQ